MEGFEKEKEKNFETLDNLILETSEEIVKANLLMPQVYSAIRVFGAPYFVKAGAMGFDDTEIIASITRNREPITSVFLDNMQASHKAAGVEVRREIDSAQMYIVAKGHLMSAFSTANFVIDDVVGPFLNEANTECIVKYFESLRNTFLSKSLRSDFVTYRKKVVSSGIDVDLLAKDVLDKMWDVYVAGTEKECRIVDSIEDARLMFIEVTRIEPNIIHLAN